MKYAPPIEQFVESLISEQGGKVVRTEYPSEPFKLFKMVALTSDNSRCLVMCIHSVFPVGEDYVESLCQALPAENADMGLLVTTGTVTSEARELARGLPIQIIDGYDYWVANHREFEPEVRNNNRVRTLTAAQMLENGFLRLVGCQDSNGDYTGLIGEFLTLDVPQNKIELWSPYGIQFAFDTTVVRLDWKAGSPLGTNCPEVGVFTLEYMQRAEKDRVVLELETTEELAQAYIRTFM